MNYRRLGKTVIALCVIQLLPGVACRVSAQGGVQDGVRTDALKVSAASHNDELAPPEHPLAPVIQVARQHHDFIRRTVKDYTCYLVKRESIDGELLPPEHMFVKFRSPRDTASEFSPFSVYVRVLAPKVSKDREVLYVRGRNGGDVIVRKGGRRQSYLTLRVDPKGRLAMRDNKYPITAFGVENLIARLVDVAEQDMEFDECEVETIRNAKVDGRSCTVYQVTHPVKRSYFRFHLARVFIDDELHLPVRYAAYDWPDDSGEPQLLEEYTYRQIKVNVGLTDRDFDSKNPEYGFSERE